MSLENIAEKETKFSLDNRNWIAKWWTSRSWWDWACHVPKAKIPKHKEEFKPGMEVNAKLVGKSYGPIRRTVGLVARTAEIAALYVGLGVGYILAAEAAPKETHNLTGWAAPFFQTAQQAGARVLDLGDALVSQRSPSRFPMTDRFNKNNITGKATIFNAPLAYAIAADNMLIKIEYQNKVNNPKHLTVPEVNDIYSMYSLEDIERITQRANVIRPGQLPRLASAKIPIEHILNPQLLGFSERALTRESIDYFHLLEKFSSADIKTVRALMNHENVRGNEVTPVLGALALIKQKKLTLSDLEKFKGYDFSTMTMLRALTADQQECVLTLKPDEPLIQTFGILLNNVSRSDAVFYSKHMAELCMHPTIKNVASTAPLNRKHSAYRYLLAYAYVNGIENLSHAQESIDKLLDPRNLAFNYEPLILFTPNRLKKIGENSQRDWWSLRRTYNIKELAELIDDGVDLGFIRKYTESQKGVPVTFEELKTIHGRLVKGSKK